MMMIIRVISVMVIVKVYLMWSLGRFVVVSVICSRKFIIVLMMVSVISGFGWVWFMVLF